MAEWAFWLAACWLALLTCCVWACLAEALRLARRPAPAPEALSGMTLIKPVKGLDPGLAQNLESIALSDPGSRVQVIVAVESREDPAAEVAFEFQRKHPERDILVLLTGPSGTRMGKAHNMIRALPRASHPLVIFSDSDALTSPELLAQTSQAFAEGCDAVFAAPLQRRGRAAAGALMEAAMNHTFSLGAALGWRALGFTHCAGAWMAYRREIIERSGGLEPIANAVADDFALSRRVARAGARGRLIAAPVWLRQSGESLGETVVHLVKWSRIIRCSLPSVYSLLPLFNPAAAALAALALAFCCGRHLQAAWLLTGLFLVSRAAAAWLHDALLGEGARRWPWYLGLAFVDFGALAFWASGFGSTIRWRGTTYRLDWDGRCKVI
ncbi:MAG: glycosyltransferase [Elusimicrobia bacterium]|nr:glycosyltransferase [Elusimicrobiota bacterium]MDE2236877.1 glycosyltransferase [Elusimicrobiota bacterium]MDE2426079.1 glycosyltransferase [Elusimicrobiota bacterium]